MFARDFRANGAYELVLFDRLPPASRETLAALASERQFYGVLRSATLPLKSVDRDTALLFLTMRDAGPLPAYVTRDASPDAIARLVLDAILEVRDGDRFVSGPAAAPLFARRTQAPRGLSMAALQYAERLLLDDANVLAGRLYAFNTIPFAPRWRELPRAIDIADARGWQRSIRRDYWQTWIRSDAPREATTHKLYVSPRPEALAESFARIVEALRASGAAQFKCGTTVHGLLRPDKIVAYFPSFDALAHAASILTDALCGVPAQGVPFTAAIDDDALLSWGADPPRSSYAELTGAASWRYWLVHRLARGLVAARAAGHAEPSRFALERLALEGVDVERWVPSASIWSAA